MLRFRSDVTAEQLHALTAELAKSAAVEELQSFLTPLGEVPRRHVGTVLRAVGAVFKEWDDALEHVVDEGPGRELELLASDAARAKAPDDKARTLRALARAVLQQLEELADSDHAWGPGLWPELERLRRVEGA